MSACRAASASVSVSVIVFVSVPVSVSMCVSTHIHMHTHTYKGSCIDGNEASNLLTHIVSCMRVALCLATHT